MSISFNIRAVNKNDLPDLLELYLDLNDTEILPLTMESQKIWDEIFKDPNYHILIGEEKGKMIASATVIIIKNLTRGMRPFAFVQNVVTAANVVNNGYSILLLERAIEIAESANCYKIMLMSGTKSENTLNFYKKAGFTDHGKSAFVKHF